MPPIIDKSKTVAESAYKLVEDTYALVEDSYKAQSTGVNKLAQDFANLAQTMPKLDGILAPVDNKFEQLLKSLEKLSRVKPPPKPEAAKPTLGNKTVRRAARVGAGALGGVTGPGPLAAAGAIGSAVSSIAGSVGNLVAKANPAAFQRFELAINDTLAVIGQGLTPIITALTPIIRSFGDVLAKMQPVIAQLSTAYGQNYAILSGLIVPVAKVVTPLLSLLTEAVRNMEGPLQALVKAVNVTADGIVWAIKKVISIYNDLPAAVRLAAAPLFGGKKLHITEFGDLKDRSSVGAAAQQARFGSIEDIGRQIRASAFSGLADPQKQTADNTKATVEALKELKKAILDRLGMSGPTSPAGNSPNVGVSIGRAITSFFPSLAAGASY